MPMRNNNDENHNNSNYGNDNNHMMIHKISVIIK